MIASDIDTSAELAAILTDETGSGNLVFSASPTLTGTVSAAAATLSSTLTMSGSSANIALGSNYLSGDGDDEGVYVSRFGAVSMGTTSSVARITAIIDNTNASSSVINTAIAGYNYATNRRIQGGDFRTYTNTTSSGTFSSLALRSDAIVTVGTGITNSGLEAGFQSSFSRGLNSSAGDGTLTTGAGAVIAYGHYTSFGGSPITTNMYGLRLQAQHRTGTITNWYDLRIERDSVGGATVTNQWSLYNDSLQRSYFAGNLGLGDLSPDNILDVHSAAAAASLAITSLGTDTDASIKFELTDNTPLFTMGIDDSDGDKFKISGSALGTDDRFVIDSSGRIGLGTTTPSGNLHIYNSAAFTAPSFSAAANQLVISRSGTGSGLTLHTADTGTNYIVFADTTLGGNNWISYEHTVDAMAFRVNNSERMRITSTGNVGIGTSTPAQKLQVFGNIRVGTTGTNGCIENYAGGVIGGTCSSDQELKTNIEPLAEEGRSYIEGLAALTPVSYNWNKAAVELYRKDKNAINLGLIAQDVESQFPELVSENEDGYKQVDFGALPFYIIEALKELWTKVQGQDERLLELEKENEYLKDRIENIEDELNLDAPAPPPEPEPTPEPNPEPIPEAEPDAEIITEPPAEEIVQQLVAEEEPTYTLVPAAVPTPE